MSDPIADMVRDYWLANEPVVWDELAKQIRQQIGQELLDEFKTRLRLKTYVPENIVREVCQLEES